LEWCQKQRLNAGGKSVCCCSILHCALQLQITFRSSSDLKWRKGFGDGILLLLGDGAVVSQIVQKILKQILSFLFKREFWFFFRRSQCFGNGIFLVLRDGAVTYQCIKSRLQRVFVFWWGRRSGTRGRLQRFCNNLPFRISHIWIKLIIIHYAPNVSVLCGFHEIGKESHDRRLSRRFALPL